ncbi:MAG: hypothetical protein V7K18_11265 [Nostoc sp.]
MRKLDEVMPKRPTFIKHFLERRLKRVPTSILKDFLLLCKTSNFSENEIKNKSQQDLIDEIILNYEIMQNNQDFNLIFNQFLRDKLFSAKESEDIMQIPKKDKVINWITSWTDNRYIGQRYNFTVHTYVKLEEKFILVDNENISLPHEIILLVAYSQTPKSIPSGLELVEYSPTTEIELVFRQNMNLLEVRGQFEVIRDFVNTAVIDSHNPLSLAQSLFIGEREDAQRNSIVKKISKVIKIDDLKSAVKGTYLTVSAPVAGSKTVRLKATLDELDVLGEETDPLLNPVLKDLLNNQDKSRISFKLSGKKYSFAITKSGGLTFMQYAPEEVMTYVLSKINKL